MYECPLKQRHFKAHTWHKLKKNKSYDTQFYAESPEEYAAKGDTLHESSKEEAKEYMIDVYKMIIRWCKDEPTLTDGESNIATKSDNNNKILESFCGSQW